VSAEELKFRVMISPSPPAEGRWGEGEKRRIEIGKK
jgi:hypothetical protein